MNFRSALITLAILATPALAQSVVQIYNFSTPVDIENSILRPNGNLLLSTFTAGQLFTIDPTSSNASAELVTALPGATALTGVAKIGDDKYAVAGGVRGNYSYTNETVYTVDYSSSADPVIETVAELPEAVLLNGAASLPASPHVILLADSRVGAIWRVDTQTGAVDIAFEDEVFTAPANASVPIGINGLKVAGRYAYFTNTARGYFGRVSISELGDKAGEVEIIAQTSASWDDFAMGVDETAYICQANNAIVKIELDGTQTVVVNDSVLSGPTSVDLIGDGTEAYVTTRGLTVDGVLQSGQVLKVGLS